MFKYYFKINENNILIKFIDNYSNSIIKLCTSVKKAVNKY